MCTSRILLFSKETGLSDCLVLPLVVNGRGLISPMGYGQKGMDA